MVHFTERRKKQLEKVFGRQIIDLLFWMIYLFTKQQSREREERQQHHHKYNVVLKSKKRIVLSCFFLRLTWLDVFVL